MTGGKQHRLRYVRNTTLTWLVRLTTKAPAEGIAKKVGLFALLSLP